MAEHWHLVARNRQAEKTTGSFSKNQKMPCPSWGISAARCITGSRLAQVSGTVCHPSVCYARKRNYTWDAVQNKLEERYNGMWDEIDGVPIWTVAMAFMMNWECDDIMRLFDSGDLQGPNHFKNVIKIAEAVPHIVIWMPTREITTVQSVTRERIEAGLTGCPLNLRPRISANLIDGQIPKGFTYTSRVVTGEGTCIAQQQGNS